MRHVGSGYNVTVLKFSSDVTVAKDADWGHVRCGMLQGIITTQHITGKCHTHEFSDILSDPYFGQFVSARQPALLHACYRAELGTSVRENVPSFANRQLLVSIEIPLAFLQR